MNRHKTKTFALLVLLASLSTFAGACHYTDDDHRYGYYGRRWDGPYYDRRYDWRYDRYYDNRYSYNWRRNRDWYGD